MEKKPTEYDDFNWVEARQNCSVIEQFKLLQETVEANVTERKEHLGKKENFQKVRLTFERDSNSQFRVMRDAPSLYRCIIFLLQKEHISVVQDEMEKKPLFDLTVILNEDGECRFKVDGEDGEFLRWQVAQKALEDILF